MKLIDNGVGDRITRNLFRRPFAIFFLAGALWVYWIG